MSLLYKIKKIFEFKAKPHWESKEYYSKIIAKPTWYLSSFNGKINKWMVAQDSLASFRTERTINPDKEGKFQVLEWYIYTL